MANNTHSIIAFFIILNALVICASIAFAGHNVPAVGNAKDVDKKQPESFIHHDGSVLVPGLGRYLFPMPGTHYNPVTYNPITGTNGGNGFTLPGSGGGSPTGHSYVPGGDDTFIPNPGFEVPSGGRVPVPSGP